MSEEELIAAAKSKCAASLSSFRNGLEDAKDLQGKPICSIDGIVLKAVSSERVIALLKEIHLLILYEVGSTRKQIPVGSFTIDLSYLDISGILSREDIRTSMTLNFKGSLFEERLDLDSHITSGSCFDYAIFKKEAQFQVFNGTTSFRNAHFRAVANFKHNFGSDAIFTGARFDSEANFIGIKFLGNVDFSNVTFCQEVNFAKSEFNSDSDFGSAIFERKVIFTGVMFNFVDFTSTEFHDVVDCSMANFKGRTCFTRTQFTKPIWLYSAELHQDTSFLFATFHSFDAEEDLRAYRTLKQKMGDFRASEEEGRFFSYEQRTRCRLLLRENWFSVSGNLSKLYDLMSEYGENITRPIGSLFAITMYFSACYYAVGGICFGNGMTDSWITKINPAIGLALQNIFNPLGLFSKQAPLIVNNAWVAMLSIVQSTLTLSAVALLLLAIRRRFHKGNGQ